MKSLQEKRRILESYLAELGSIIVAFSAGVDSTLLLKIAHDVLGERAVAVTVRSCLFPERERTEAEAFCEAEGIEHILVELVVFSIEGFSHNPKNRCYLCKRELFMKIRQMAEERGIPYIAEGSNIDDNSDYRPGMEAVRELDIKSPLQKAGLTKAEIRQLSRETGLSTWEKPSFACLASRFVYGEIITEKKLSMVEQAEKKLFAMGFHQVRVRVHGNLARIEVGQSEFDKMFQPGTMQTIHHFLLEIGFSYVTLDLGGYQMGSMNHNILL